MTAPPLPAPLPDIRLGKRSIAACALPDRRHKAAVTDGPDALGTRQPQPSEALCLSDGRTMARSLGYTYRRALSRCALVSDRCRFRSLCRFASADFRLGSADKTLDVGGMTPENQHGKKHRHQHRDVRLPQDQR